MGSKSKSTTNENFTETRQNVWDQSIRDQFDQGFSQLSGLFQQRLGQPLNLKFADAFSKSPDAIVQNMVSRGVQSNNLQQDAANRALATQLSTAGSGNNSALLAALQRQGRIAGAGANNALIPAALEAQRNFDLQRQQVLQSQNAQQLAARAQSFQELAPGFDLLSQLQNLGAQTAKQTGTRQGSSTTKSGSGIFGF